MKRALLTLGASGAAAALAVTAVVTGTASAQPRRHDIVIGQSLQFVHGPGSSTGTFTLAGALHASGSVTSSASLAPGRHPQEAILTGTETFTSGQGTFTTTFTGTDWPAGAPQQAVKGTWRVTSGTGAYSELKAKGSFVIVANLPAGTLIRTDQARVKG